MFKILRRVISALILGLVLSIWILQNNTAVKKQVYSKIITALQKEWDAHIDVESFKINFFTCSIFFKDGKIFPTNQKNYAWKFEQGLVHVSPWQLVFNKRIALDIAFTNVKAYTAYHNKQSDLINHVYGMFKQKAGGMPIGAESIAIHNIDLAIKLLGVTTKSTATPHMLVIHAPGTIAFNKQNKAADPQPHSWKGSAQLAQASAVYDGLTIIHNLNGTCTLHKQLTSGNWFCQSHATLKSNALDHEKTYTCTGTWNQAQKTLSLADQTGALTLTGTGTFKQHAHLKGTIPLATLSNGIRFIGSDLASPLNLPLLPQGSCALDVSFDQNDITTGFAGSVVLSDLKIATVPLQQIAINLTPTNAHGTTSEIAIMQSPQAQLSGSLQWDWDTARGSLTLTNTSPLSLPQKETTPADFSILPNDLTLSVSFGKQTNTHGTYLCILTNKKTEKPYTYKGAFLFKNNALGIKGKTSQGDYELGASLIPHPHIKSVRYTVRNRTLIDMQTTAPYTLSGTIRWAFLRSFLDQSLQRLTFNDTCILTANLYQQDITRPAGSFRLSQGNFFIPDFHNLIQNVALEWQADTTEKKLTVDNVSIELSKGTITCPRATATWDAQFNLSMLHASIAIKNTFINWKRDFYGIAYGNLLLNKLPNSVAKLSGILVLKKSLLKDTFFSQESAQNFYGPLGSMATASHLPFGLNIRLMTEKPVAAKTPVLNANATLDLTINNIVNKNFSSTPYLTGSINLDNGYLKFFHNKLRIEHGKIQFVANHFNDPLIDLIAKNRINKYLINLQVTGSLQKPTILLESTPELTEEQIIGLLLSGSENASLQADLPAMLMQNLDSLIFKNRKNSKHAGLVDTISKTFKYIQITPNLGDNADAGKLKGSISVNLNDQLRAQIQKNLDLQKDFSAHIEYMLSDDINLKFIKDQRGELGSEVEMRLKLG